MNPTERKVKISGAVFALATVITLALVASFYYSDSVVTAQTVDKSPDCPPKVCNPK